MKKAEKCGQCDAPAKFLTLIEWRARGVKVGESHVLCEDATTDLFMSVHLEKNLVSFHMEPIR